MTDASPEVAARFLARLMRQDWPAIRELLAEDIWMRALLTREVVEAHDAPAVLEALRTWHGEGHGFVVLDRERETVELRERVRYRFAMRPSWAPEEWHVIEQTGYLRVRDGRITRLDLTCTGYHPVAEPPAPSAAVRDPVVAAT